LLERKLIAKNEAIALAITSFSSIVLEIEKLKWQVIEKLRERRVTMSFKGANLDACFLCEGLKNQRTL